MVSLKTFPYICIKVPSTTSREVSNPPGYHAARRLLDLGLGRAAPLHWGASLPGHHQLLDTLPPEPSSLLIQVGV